MPHSFEKYANLYDIIYKDKDYQAECDFLEKIFKRYSKKPIRKILDIACGTGNHIIPLAQRGFNVAAQDKSCDMLQIAKRKCHNENLKISFMGCFPMQQFNHKKKFDAVIAMFSSIDYVVKLKEVKKVFLNIHNCLRKNGLLVFDFWNKTCVDKYFTPYKRKVFRKGNELVVRISKTSLDRKISVAKVNFICDYFVNKKHVAKINEVHKMKYYDISHMRKILESCGFKILGTFPFMSMDRKVTGKDWNISIVASPS
jgi:SAM-dependent methyltransferase